jgi:signal transduction histidine kinase
MDRLINAILRLSRLGHTELDLQPLDMNELVEEIVNSFVHRISKTGAEVSIGALPEIVADRTAMEQIVGNLLDNALKYLHPDRPARIEISGWSDGEDKVFQVRDNGVGIEEGELERIFQIFQRSGRQDVPGEGMGLAYVKTLARRHCGHVWCESELGIGSNFSFTIPGRLSDQCEAI